MDMGGIFKAGNTGSNCFVKQYFRGVFETTFVTSEQRNLTCAKEGWVTKLRYFPLTVVEETLTAGDDTYITDLPMKEETQFTDSNQNTQTY